MKEIIAFEYDGLYTVEFELDKVLFTPEHARDGLEFFTWDYDTEADPIVEMLRKYAMEALRVSVSGCGLSEAIQHFMDAEGFYKLDGTHGIRLVRLDRYELDDNMLELK